MSSKLMIVDDDVGIARTYARTAAQAGFEVQIVTQPIEALNAFMEFQPNVLLLDMMMPEKDGIDLLNEILLTGVPVRVIATSGYGAAYLRLASAVATFHGVEPPTVLRKPVRKADLVRSLTEAAAQ